MPRRRRAGTAGIVHHVMNRANRRDVIFFNDLDFAAFERVLFQAKSRFQIPLFGFVVMPNHWHLIVQPTEDHQLSQFMHWLTMTHTQRWHRDHGTSGSGSLYQGRYKALPVQSERYFLTLARYVERNPVRAGLVDRAENWNWSSAWHVFNLCDQGRLDGWPLTRPVNWFDLVNEPQHQIDLSKVREAITRSRPLGEARWVRTTAGKFGLERTIRPQGRPCKK
jgi:putative transposase